MRTFGVLCLATVLAVSAATPTTPTPLSGKETRTSRSRWGSGSRRCARPGAS